MYYRFNIAAKFLTVFVLLIGSQAYIQAQEESHLDQSISISLLTEINHPYLFYKKESKELTGIAYEIVTELLRRANISGKIKVLPWMRAVRTLDNDDNSCLFIMNRTPERESKYTWVGPMILGHIALYQHQDSKLQINSIADIGRNRVIGKIDGLALKSLRREIIVNAVHTSSDEQSAELLFRRRADLWITGDIDGPMAISSLHLPKPKLVLKSDKTILSMGCSLNMLGSTLSRLKSAHNSMTEFRLKVIEKYIR